MKLDPATLSALDLEGSAKYVTQKPLDRFPRLILDRCLEDSAPSLAKYISAAFSAGYSVESETITMPRRGFGPRPVVVVGPVGRVIYKSLVHSIRKSLPEPSRGEGKYDRHKKFGLDGDHEYVVDLDIAACYEYVDHAVLRDELLLRSMDVKISDAIFTFLGEISERSRGLPQMQEPSDSLADAYLSILERKLGRAGYSVSRYADDIRVIAKSWEDANNIIEYAAEYARELGLILSSEKTRIYKRTTLIEQQQEDAIFFDLHIREAKQTLTQVIRAISQSYGGVLIEEEIEVKPDTVTAAQAAYWKVLSDWWGKVREGGAEADADGPANRMLPLIFVSLVGYEKRISNRLLRDAVFYQPQRLESVSRYIVARSKLFPDEDHWRTVSGLTKMARQSPWAKLWLLDTIEKLEAFKSAMPDQIKEWLKQQLSDRHEYVRAQAAWVCAMYGDLTTGEVGRLYRVASRMTHPALAAAVSRQGNIEKAVRRAIEDDHPLNREAMKWAEA